MSRTSKFLPSPNNQNYRPLYFPDCIHLSEQCTCTILTVGECLGDSCSFCKDTKVMQNSTGSSMQRLSNLSDDQQRIIAASYYGGSMPWKELVGKGYNCG